MPLRRAPLRPRAQLFVCVNRRPPGDPLGEGCAGRGDATYAALKDAVGAGGLVRAVYVTRTHCLGQCPPRGATVVVEPAHDTFVEAEPGDAAALLAHALGSPAGEHDAAVARADEPAAD